MITKEEALTAEIFHYCGSRPCTPVDSPRRAITKRSIVARRNGVTQTWTRSPHRFRVPVKYGAFTYGQITEENAEDWHTAETCPLNVPQPQKVKG